MLYTDIFQTWNNCEGLPTELYIHISICLLDIFMYAFNKIKKNNRWKLELMIFPLNISLFLQ